MPRLIRYYGQNHVHFITTSTYRRARLFDFERFRRIFARSLGDVRDALRFKLIGYVLMPEHFHILLWPGDQANPSEIVRSLKIRTAMQILKELRDANRQPWYSRMLSKLVLPETVHSPATYRIWQRRFYDMNICSERKLQEKLTYIHNNPVKRRLVESADKWPWSSFGYSRFEDDSILKRWIEFSNRRRGKLRRVCAIRT